MTIAMPLAPRRPRARCPAAAALAALALAVVPSLASAAASATPPEIYAVVVGYNGGGAGLPALRFADDDAVRFALLFGALDTVGRPSHVTLLADLDADTQQGLTRAGLAPPPHAPPTRAALLGAIAAVGRALAARPATAAPAVLYIVYAGHGLPGRILLKPEGAPEAAITGHELRAAIADVARAAPGLQTFLFLDACRSQSLFSERGAAADPELGPDLAAHASDLEQRASAVRIGVLTAAASGKPAGEVRDLGAGYFSHVLASGLAGAADADGDDVVSFGELAAFVAFNTERLTGQRPWFAPPGGDLGAPAIDHRGRRTRIELSSAPAGRYLFLAAPGRPTFAEAFKGDRGPLRLALPAGRYRVQLTASGGAARHADVELRANQPLDLAQAPWADDAQAAAPPGGARGEAAEAGATPPVFGAPFTPEAVSALTAGYAAGREPAAAIDTEASSLGAAFGAGGAPLGLDGAEASAALRFRRRLGGGLFGGARLLLARSSHTAAGGYDLDRASLLVEAGPRWSPARRLALTLAAAAGAGTLVRHGSAGAASGDPLAPIVAAGAGAELRLPGSFLLFADVRYAVQWIRIDGARKASGDPAAELGVAFGF